jgi:hypothetical protein
MLVTKKTRTHVALYLVLKTIKDYLSLTKNATTFFKTTLRKIRF